MKFTDTHAHLYSEDYDTDLSEVISASIEVGVEKIIVPATSFADYLRLEQICEEYKGVIFPAYGLHPTNIDKDSDIEFELTKIVEKIESGGQIVALGETGLDRYWSLEFWDQQLFSLRRHFELSIKYNLPLIIHARDAFDELIELLEEYKGTLHGVIHGFSGTKSDVEKILNLGDFMFGIGGVVTFKNSTLPATVREIPLEKILLETDAPYLTPTPYRGKRNLPKFIPLIAEKISEIKNISLEKVSQITEENREKMFKL